MPTKIAKKTGKKPKLSDKVFWECLEKSYGLFSQAATMIEQKTGQELSRREVYERAHRQPERLNDINEGVLDKAESGLFKLMKSKNSEVSLRATKYYLKNKKRTKKIKVLH